MTFSLNKTEFKSIISPYTYADYGFRIEVDRYATSPDIQKAIWVSQHVCVEEGSIGTAECSLTSQLAGKAVIKHQLKGDRGHYSVLKGAYIKFVISGFPHSAVMQWSRHEDSFKLVQSNRYTSQRFIDVAEGNLNVNDVFYFPMPTKHLSREGDRYEWTEETISNLKNECIRACKNYRNAIRMGMAAEEAREMIPMRFRQVFTFGGTLEALWHALDQRSKKDSQFEARILAEMMHLQLMKLCPELQQWYEENRYGKALLAP